MKITTFIVEDSLRQYNKIKSLLKETDFADFIELVGIYQGDQPFDEALKFININQPQLLIIDWDLEEGNEKTGIKLFENINPYPCFVIFCSTWSSPEVVNAYSKFSCAKFLLKSIPEIFSKVDLLNLLDNSIKPYFIDNLEISLSYYKDGISKPDLDNNILNKHFLCKNLVCIKGNGKTFDFLYLVNDHPIEYKGNCSKASDISEWIERTKYPYFKLASKRPITWYNEKYYSKVKNSNKLLLNKAINSQVFREI